MVWRLVVSLGEQIQTAPWKDLRLGLLNRNVFNML